MIFRKSRTIAGISIFAAALILALLITTAATAQDNSTNSIADFFRSISGQWIGTCDQSTNGEQAETKYFSATVKHDDDNTFTAKFDYFRYDTAQQSLIPIGSSDVVTTIAPDGTAKTQIIGSGVILVDEKPKNQNHELNEVLKIVDGCLTGEGTGKLSVSGMPLGLGKNGQVRKDTSAWSINNGVLTISQALNVRFKALIFSKSFDVEAKYTAIRGTDVAELVNNPIKVAASPAGSAAGQVN